jgi:hypothetical protein
MLYGFAEEPPELQPSNVYGMHALLKQMTLQNNTTTYVLKNHRHLHT